jgi:hypothetical protein
MILGRNQMVEGFAWSGGTAEVSAINVGIPAMRHGRQGAEHPAADGDTLLAGLYGRHKEVTLWKHDGWDERGI